MLSNYAMTETLIQAILDNDIEKAKALLASGVDPNSHIDQDKLTPLHFAVQNNTLEIAFLLIEAGADVNARGIDGCTPLDVAQIHRHMAIQNLLLPYLQPTSIQ